MADKSEKTKRTETWVITDHACLVCFGRLLKRRISPKVTEVICPECEARSYGDEHALCWCGKSVGIYGKIFECFRNPNIRPELPNVILVKEKSINPVVKQNHSPRTEKVTRKAHCPSVLPGFD